MLYVLAGFVGGFTASLITQYRNDKTIKELRKELDNKKTSKNK